LQREKTRMAISERFANQKSSGFRQSDPEAYRDQLSGAMLQCPTKTADWQLV